MNKNGRSELIQSLLSPSQAGLAWCQHPIPRGEAGVLEEEVVPMGDKATTEARGSCSRPRSGMPQGRAGRGLPQTPGKDSRPRPPHTPSSPSLTLAAHDLSHMLRAGHGHALGGVDTLSTEQRRLLAAEAHRTATTQAAAISVG